LFTKKLLIVSPSAVFRLTLKKFLEEKFEVDTNKTKNIDFKNYDLIVFDKDSGDEYKKFLNKTVLIGGTCEGCLEKPDFISEEFKIKLLGEIEKKLFPKKIKKPVKVQLHSAGKYVLIGSSTGGPGLIETIAKSLPVDYPYPVCVVQHMPVNFTAKFASRLNTVSALNVVEADNTTAVVKGSFIIAKGGWHLHFRNKDGVVYCKLAPNSKNRFFIPSVDEMFFSALEVINPKDVMAVVLTGIGDDGADGLTALRKAGAYTVAESEKTAAVYGMPKAAKEKGGACKVLDFPDIVKEIIKFGEN
jgi:two-component system chemotaxis response regulator CheB